MSDIKQGNEDAPVRVVLGSMEMGRNVDEKTAQDMIDVFINAGHTEVDTALMYAGGETQNILGRLSADQKGQIQIATKLNPWGKNNLTAQGIRNQFNRCNASLQKQAIDILYLHAPDHQTPILDTLQGINQLYSKGKFKRFGLSNYASWQVTEIYYLCKANDFLLPTVYQGMYNCLTRQVEAELVPCLRKFGISFYVYNPLAGGLLTGRYKYDDLENEPQGRFFGNNWAVKYRERYWKRSTFDALELIETKIEEAYPDGSVSFAEAALRWCTHHSALKGMYGDAVIVGSSSLTHLTENLNSCSTDKGELEAIVVEAMDEAAEMFRPDCPCYFR